MLWNRIKKNAGRGEATLVYNTNNEWGYAFRTTRKDTEVVDADGIPLIKELFQQNIEPHYGFSNAYKYHQARKMQNSYQQNPAFVVLDIETTGLDPRRNQIISIGAIKRESGKNKTFYRLVKLETNKNIPSNIARVTGLNNRLLNVDGIPIREAMLGLKYFVKSLPIVGYNLSFDERFLQQAIIKNNIVQMNNKMIDLLPFIKKMDKFCDNYHLTTILNKYGIKNEHPHNALFDSKATLELTNKLIEKYGFKIVG